MIEYKIIDYTDSHINNEIIGLYKKIFRFDFSESFEWWYLENPSGKSTGVIASEGGKVIGHWAVTPLPFLCNGEEEIGLISLAAMVDESCQGQGIFKEMSNKLFEYLQCRTSYPFIIGFPNDNSLFVHVNRMGYHHIRDFQFIKFEKQPDQMHSYRWIDKFNDTLKDGIGINKKSSYAEWRFKNNCYDFYESDNGIKFVVTRFKNCIDILEWSESALKSDVIDFASFLYKENEDVAVVKTWNLDIFKNAELYSERKYHFCIKKLLDKAETNISLLDEKKWHIQMGDAELF